MNRSNETSFQRHVRYAFYALAAAALIFVGYYLIAKLLFPIVLAWLLALLLQPLIRFVTRLTRLPRKSVSAVIFVLILSALSTLFIFLFNRLYREVAGLVGYLAENGDSLIDAAKGKLDGFFQRFGFLSNADEISRYVIGVLGQSLQNLTAGLTGWLGAVVTGLPEKLFVLLIFLMATFYLTLDFDKTERKLNALLPNQFVRVFGNIKGRLSRTVIAYIRAYLILLAITFGELLLAFSLLRLRYALLLALVISLLDVLPAIGVGTVLLPWAGYCFFSGEPGRGISLLIVFGAVTLIRQIIEPHIVGSQLGLSPFLTLISVYIGYRISGLFGVLIAPILTILIQEIFALYFTKNQPDPLQKQNNVVN